MSMAICQVPSSKVWPGLAKALAMARPRLKPWPWALDSADKISEWYLNRHHNAVIQQQSYLTALSLVDYDAGLGFVHLIDQ